ncbi:DUF5723 family protein [Flavobacterium columnare]|uniref:DUF5723 family protein n=1 Tax=Flavobacterium columnare TaxID=996 RepID=UPI000D19B214|nr:DUF5723 family protein [Flavobacterium columnare]PTD15140.1 flagellar motor protein MotB [Flavobacterium columnare]
MKKILALFSLFLCTEQIEAQSYIGFVPDNYSGVHGMIYNPATVVGSPYRLDLNLVSGSALLGNDYFGVKITDLFKSNYDVNLQSKKFASLDNNIIINADLLGPSFMFNIAPKHSIGFFSRARANFNVHELNGTLFDKFENNFKDTKNYNIDEGDFNMVMNAWAELGLSYGAIILNNDQYTLKGGLSLKYLQGVLNSYAYGKNISLFFDAENITKNQKITATGDFVYGGTRDFDKVDEKIKYNPNSSGVGADLGVVFEIKNQEKQKKYGPNYKWKFGASVTDIGSINYKTNTENHYEFNSITVNQVLVDSAGDLDKILALFDTSPEVYSSQKVMLPTALHANIDWNFFRKFYLNVNGDFNLNDRKALNTLSIANSYMLTPRYETKWFSIAVPVNYLEYRGLNVGTSLRLGPLFLGSGSILSNLVSSESKGIDAYVGLKVPIYKGEKRIKEPKEIKKSEPAPVVQETIIPDTDNDGLLDNVDQCINEKGPKENGGCPYKDTDNDGVIDPEDKCVTVVGPAENNGCPWPDTDGDMVLDKDDKCVNVPGTIKNNGCPEVTQAVVKKLNDYAKTILFDAGRNTFQSSTYPVLEAMSALLNEYPTAKFSLEGHTDSVGKAEVNKKLSESRASAIMNYLVSKGIDKSRLKAIGYGESKPIASNKTKAGKALNRRVEVKLIIE